ncbi:unnamed protein product [Cyberlindnera jadinii]|uniref:Uncharacterized protein n=1 Tax=Cyberlindnera jadinii (strain ATCC 18201 / CBS 1600 / BCRC 20928 / JCM 3617 / NBRC 0987 / NRRL Y-1542) TaxID=983966 RepID=A0A0H5C4Z4_CYBJN|nr:unnamed protein product [Cyberlindnera jadinii]
MRLASVSNAPQSCAAGLITVPINSAVTWPDCEMGSDVLVRLSDVATVRCTARRLGTMALFALMNGANCLHSRHPGS